MPKVSPEKLKPYLFHGLDLQWRNGDKQALGECPFCGGEKFSVKIETGQCKCWNPSCAIDTNNKEGGGNASSFLRKLSEVGLGQPQDYTELAESRGVTDPDFTFEKWGIFRSPITGRWLIPGYSAEGVLIQLYAYGSRPMPTTTLKHQIFGMNLYNSKKHTVFICEGPWDAIVLWEAFSKTCYRGKAEDEDLAKTSNVAKSLLENTSVIAVPGCNTFFDKWCSLFTGKTVVLMYDSDHPKVNPNDPAKQLAPVGTYSMEMVAGKISKNSRPEMIKYLKWGEDGYDPDLPSGYDVRDALDADDRVEALGKLLDRIEVVPDDWITDTDASVATGLPELPCTEHKTMVQAWRKALKWTEGLDRALSVMLASITSTKVLGDQLWIKVIGPASCGKSTLCEAVSANTRFVLAKSTIRGFHSGFKTGKDGDDEDNSLISKLGGKTLVTKDGDTLLQSPNLGQILSEARDIYDCTSRTHYRNKMGRDYSGVRMTWLLCGTSSLRSIDSSELGERFLDCVIMDKIDDALEDDILWRVANRANRNVSIEATEEAEAQNEPALTEAMQLTSGYVSYLRDNAPALLAEVEFPDGVLYQFTRLGKFIAYMRARPSWRQAELAEREFGARLVSQLVRLSKCLAVVLNRNNVDDTVMKVVTQVALDTSRGVVLDMVKDLYDNPGGVTKQGIAARTNNTVPKTEHMLRFLTKVGAAESRSVKIKSGKSQVRYFLTDSVNQLYEDVMENNA